MAFNIMDDPSTNIFGNLSGACYKSVREGIIRCILATDMARHNEILSQFNDIVPVFNYQDRSHINLVSCPAPHSLAGRGEGYSFA